LPLAPTIDLPAFGFRHIANDLHLLPLLAELAPYPLLAFAVLEAAEPGQERLELRRGSDGPLQFFHRGVPGVFARRAVVRRRAASSSRTAPSGGS
jgi:hypothetical protein